MIFCLFYSPASCPNCPQLSQSVVSVEINSPFQIRIHLYTHKLVKEAFRCPEYFTSAHADFSLSVYFMAEIIGIGALSYLQDIKENFTSNQCLFGVSTSEKKKESLPFKPTYLWSSLKAPTGSKVSVSIPKSFSSRINYSYVHFLHMALLPLSASSHLHNFSSAEWLLFFTLLIRNLYFLQFSRQSLSHKISHDCLSLYFWPAFECTWLWMAPSFPNVCRLQNREIVVLTFLYAPTFCFTKCTYFLGYFIYLEVILP